MVRPIAALGEVRSGVTQAKRSRDRELIGAAKEAAAPGLTVAEVAALDHAAGARPEGRALLRSHKLLVDEKILGLAEAIRLSPAPPGQRLRLGL